MRQPKIKSEKLTRPLIAQSFCQAKTNVSAYFHYEFSQYSIGDSGNSVNAINRLQGFFRDNQTPDKKREGPATAEPSL